MEKDSTTRIRYVFTFPEGAKKVFDVELERKTGVLVRKPCEEYPSWTHLEYCRCRHCPLTKETHPYCPVATSIVDVMEFFHDYKSIKQANVVVETEQRTSSREQTALYPAISSLMGIHMASSGCPIMDKLRPMVLHHLPFASMEETMYRALSMYALAQHFRSKAGLDTDPDFSGLGTIYQDVNTLNKDFSVRFKGYSDCEATTNAIVSLDCFAQMIEFSITEEMLEDLEAQFESYL
ncbi:MAG TPA: hypothetical protein DCX06_02300 [Opitutae bacterium]|nr:hypothetical protein [Opitutae bacterium]